MTDFSDMARGIIESNRYMVLGTADQDGVPWVTPVWFAQSDHRRFIWVSSPERRHSRNVKARPEVSIVIFDSRVAVGERAGGVHVGARRGTVGRRTRTRRRHL
jgi:nitroimidazol reductase NimA-like FMN-containing flavoprotein (pyridoxamine 5'-phosphate oxidase superfamily)